MGAWDLGNNALQNDNIQTIKHVWGCVQVGLVQVLSVEMVNGDWMEDV